MLISSKYLPSSCRRSFSGRHSGSGQWQDVLCRSVGVNPHPGTSWSWNAKDKVMKWIIKTIGVSLKDQRYNNPPVHVGNVKHNLLAQYLDRANAKPSNITVFSQSYLEQAGSYLKGSLRTILRSEVSTEYRCLSECLATDMGKTESGPRNKSACPDCYQIPYTQSLSYKVLEKISLNNHKSWPEMNCHSYFNMSIFDSQDSE